MSCCLEDLHINSDSLSRLAKEQDRLGFRGFVEGRLSRQFEQRQRRHYWRMDSMRSSTKKWAANLVDHIFRFTHCQWTYWNNFVHYRARDGAETVAEYKARMKQIEMVFDQTDPEELLEDDQHLLSEFNPENLAGASSEERILWEEEMQAVKSAAFFDDISREDMDVSEEENRMSVESVECKGDQASIHNQLE